MLHMSTSGNHMPVLCLPIVNPLSTNGSPVNPAGRGLELPNVITETSTYLGSLSQNRRSLVWRKLAV